MDNSNETSVCPDCGAIRFDYCGMQVCEDCYHRAVEEMEHESRDLVSVVWVSDAAKTR